MPVTDSRLPWRTRRALPLAAAMLLACGGGGGAGPDLPPPSLVEGACLNAATGECHTYRLPAPDLENARQGCPWRGWGTWIPSCPAENRLGTCAIQTEGGGPSELTWYPGWLSSVDDARTACRGSFAPGSGSATAASQQRLACDRRQTLQVEVPFFPTGACTEVDAPMTAEFLAALRFYCAFHGGTPLPPTVPCPAEGRIGTCRVAIAGGPLRGLPFDARYYAPRAGSCSALGGVWSDG